MTAGRRRARRRPERAVSSVLETSLQRQAEYYLGTNISPQEWQTAKTYAERKLARIIQREGDAGGARWEPWYLAKLIAETVQADALTSMLNQLADLQWAKKDSPRQSARPSHTNAYCTTV